jgi:hypothetical protein
MVNATREPLHDGVEVDETWVGASRPVYEEADN